MFTLDSSTGELSFHSAPDYENPADSNFDNAYEVNLQVVDSVGNFANQALVLEVRDMIDLSTVVFTNAGATGRYGPTQGQVDAAYQGTELAGQVSIVTQGIQEWTVPFSGAFSIEAWGLGAGMEKKGRVVWVRL